MKKAVMILLAAVLVLVSACGGVGDTQPKETETETETQVTTEQTSVTEEEEDEPPITVTGGVSRYYTAVKAALYGMTKSGLALPVVKCDNTVGNLTETNSHYSAKAEVYLGDSAGYPFAEICSEMNENPIACFRHLVKVGLMNKDRTDEEGVSFNYCAGGGEGYFLNARVPDTAKKRYSYTYEGCSEFVQAVRAVSNSNIGGLGILDKLNDAGSGIPVYYSETDECYYTYGVVYNTTYAYMIAVYLRSSDGAYITDSEFQLLHIAYPNGNYECGVSIVRGMHYEMIDFEIVSLTTAMEQLLCGQYYMDSMNIPTNHLEQEYTIPAEYSVGEYKARLSLETFSGSLQALEGSDCCILYNYRISK